MSDLIDRQAVIDALNPWLNVEGYSEGEVNMLRAVLYELKTLPSAEPVIQCEDCRHSAVVATMEHNDGTVEKYYMCKLLREGTDADGFCHRGERKEQTEDDADECCDADEEE